MDVLELHGEIVYSVDGGRLLICLALELTAPVLRAMMQRRPETVLCLDRAFDDDDRLLRNTLLEMKSHGVAHFRTV